MRILVICDDSWHPGEVVKAGLSLLIRNGVHLYRGYSDFELSGMTGYQFVILSKSTIYHPPAPRNGPLKKPRSF